VYALAVSSSNVYAGGAFTTAGSSPATNIAQWDGSRWTALGPGLAGGFTGTSLQVSALAVSGTNLYAGGSFTTAGGSAVTNIAKWDGSNWTALGSGMGPTYPNVVALAVSGTNLYAGGVFTTANGIAANYIAKWDGSNWAALGSGANQAVDALAVSGSDLYAGGYFGTAGGKVSPYIARANLLTLPTLPTATLLFSGANVILKWPTNAIGYTLQSTTNLISPVVWTTNPPAPVVVNGQNTVTNLIFGGQKFYRLTQ
jgi:hypothetical protein